MVERGETGPVPASARPPIDLPPVEGTEPITLVLVSDGDHADAVVGSVTVVGLLKW